MTRHNILVKHQPHSFTLSALALGQSVQSKLLGIIQLVIHPLRMVLGLSCAPSMIVEMVDSGQSGALRGGYQKIIIASMAHPGGRIPAASLAGLPKSVGTCGVTKMGMTAKLSVAMIRDGLNKCVLATLITFYSLLGNSPCFLRA